MPRTSERPTAPKPKRAPTARKRLGVEARRTQLIELGIEAFGAEPYDAVSVEEVAARAGTSKGLLYHYFPTKRDFYIATLAEVSKRLLERTDFSSDPDPIGRLSKGLQAYFAFIERHGAAYGSLLRSGVGMDRQALAIIEATRNVFAERLIQAFETQLTPLARIALVGWIGFVEATSLDWVAKKSVERDDLVNLWVGQLLSLTARFGISADDR